MKRKRKLTVPKSTEEWDALVVVGQDETKDAYDGEWWKDFMFRRENIRRPLPSTQILASSSTSTTKTTPTKTGNVSESSSSSSLTKTNYSTGRVAPLLQNFFVALGIQGTSNKGEGEGNEGEEEEEEDKGRYCIKGIAPDALDIGTLHSFFFCFVGGSDLRSME